jgi:hypothetical protein
MIVVLYVRGDQLDQLRESHYRKHQSLRGISHSSKSNHQDILSAGVFFSVIIVSKKVNTNMKTEGLIRSGKKSLCL